MTHTKQTTPTMPDAAGIAELPRRARVAWAARCARRALCLLTERFGVAVSEAADALDAVVTAVENEGRGADTGMSLQEVHDLAKRVCITAHEKMAESLTGESPPSFACLAGVAEVAVYAVRAALADSVERSATAAYNAALQSRLVAGTDADGGEDLPRWEAALHAIRSDCDRLHEAATRLAWVRSTCVPPDWFGPLWPGEHSNEEGAQQKCEGAGA